MDSQLRSSALTQIPVELLLRITYHLTSPELGNVRLVCKALERSLFNFFSHEFFRKRQFMILERSLQTLIDISRHPALSPFLRHVIIATDSLEWVDISQFMVATHRSRNLHVAQTDQLSLLTTATARDMLAEAFKNLPNLEIVDLRDFNSNTRKRDGSPWTSYGAPTLKNAGVYPNLQSGPAQIRGGYPSELYSIILSALAASGARPPNIEVVLRKVGWGLTDRAMAVPKFLEPSLFPVLSGLRKLLLTMDFDQSGLTSPRVLGDSLGTYNTRAFLSHCPNLTFLRLNFRNQDPGRPGRRNITHTEQFLEWLGTSVPNGSSLAADSNIEDGDSSQGLGKVEPIQLAALKTLEFGFLETNINDLLRIVKKFAPTLQRLNFHKITLEGKLPDQSDDDWEGDYAKPNLWARLFTALSKAAQNGLTLHQLGVGDMHQRLRGGSPLNAWRSSDGIFFQQDEGGTREYGRQHTEPGSMLAFLDELASEVRIQWSALGESRDSDPESEDEDEDNDEDGNEEEGEGEGAEAGASDLMEVDGGDTANDENAGGNTGAEG